jgi:hypothetical protein
MPLRPGRLKGAILVSGLIKVILWWFAIATRRSGDTSPR